MTILRALVPALALVTALGAAEPATAAAAAPAGDAVLAPTGVLTATLSQNGRVRYGPSKDARIVTTLRKGQTVDLLGKSKSPEWWIVRFPAEAKVWMHAKVLLPIDGGKRWRVAEDGARARDDARVTAEIVTELSKGEIVEDRGLMVGDWRAVYPPDAVAYMHESVLSLPADLPKALAAAAERGDAAKTAWTQAQAKYAQFKTVLADNREAALQLDWLSLAALLDTVIAGHPDAEVKLAAQRLKEPVQTVVAAVDQVRVARGQAPLPKPVDPPPTEVKATEVKATEVKAVEVKPTTPAGPQISDEQVRKLQEAAAQAAQFPAQGFMSQQGHPKVGVNDVLIDDDGKVVAFIKVKPGVELKLGEFYWRWVGVKGVKQAVDPALHDLGGSIPLIEVEDVKLLKH
ncbi:MAG: SH3 domain-containing protein [Planctomycetes bacterium]|nr:SH3 domain-containing protein [Planctomycetota bacterium]